MNAFFEVAGPVLVSGGGLLLAAAFIALLRLLRGEDLRPRPLRPLRLSPGPEPVGTDWGFCPECTGRRYGHVFLDGSFRCGGCGHHQPVSGAITVETPAPAPSAGAGAGTNQGD